MRRVLPLLATVCLLAVAPAYAQSTAGAEICAASDDAAVSPEQRIAACTAVIDAAKDRPAEASAALTHRGSANWYINKMSAAFADLDRAIADFNEAIRLSPRANFLTNRGDAYQNKGEIDRAIDDYDRALKLNSGFTLAYNNRGAAYGRKGDLDRSIADYEQALRIDPQLDSAAENLAKARQKRDRRIEASTQSRLPTFDCATAKRAVEKAICSDPDLIRLDRDIDDAYKAALGKLDRDGVARLRRDQRAFNARRNFAFGHPEYQLKRELERRLMTLRGMAAGN